MTPANVDHIAISSLIVLAAAQNGKSEGAGSSPFIEAQLLEVLSPFTITIEKIEKISLRGRLILGVLITLDPAHALAIESDLTAFGELNNYDVAMDYSDE